MFLPQSVWNGGKRANDSSISLAVSRDMNVRTSSGVWYAPFSSAVNLQRLLRKCVKRLVQFTPCGNVLRLGHRLSEREHILIAVLTLFHSSRLSYLCERNMYIVLYVIRLQITNTDFVSDAIIDAYG